MEKYSVLIVSRHPLFREGLARLLADQPAVEVIAVVSEWAEAQALIARRRPDAIIVDHDEVQLQRLDLEPLLWAETEGLKVIYVTLAGNEMIVHERRRVTNVTAEGLVQVMENSKKGKGLPKDLLRRYRMNHLVRVAVLVVIVTIAVSAFLDSIPLLPLQASAQAVPIDNLFGPHLRVISFLFALILVFLVYSVIAFRRRPGETGDGDHIEGHTGLEIAWTIAPLATVLFFSYLGAQALAETRRVDPQAMEVKVISQQWSWSFEYPQYNLTSTALNLPVNRQVLLKLTSKDVIHSFWVPEFRVKQDALPGEDMVKELRITPTKVGKYKVRCAELCGTSHAYMESPVVVMEPAEFENWVKEQSQLPTDPVERGKNWSAQFGCTACHTIDGSVVVGPSWKGLYGKQETMADGTTLTADDAYLIESIRNPGAKIVKGFNNIMPANVAGQMTDDQVKDVIEYIKSLK